MHDVCAPPTDLRGPGCDPPRRSEGPQAFVATLASMIRPARARAIRRLPLAVALAAGLAGALAGCAPSGVEPSPTTSAPSETPAPPPEFFPEGTAEENLPYFEYVLDGFAAGVEPVEGRPVVDAVAAAGFDRAAMQVSFDRTQTNLVADSIFVSVRIGADCLLGQVVAADRSVSAMTAPAVGPEQSLCLIGNTRPIDW